MDYKVKLQTNNTNLTNNNVDLQSILDTINNLPNASGGGSELQQVEVTVCTEGDMNCTCIYISQGQLTLHIIEGTFLPTEDVLTVDSGTLFVMTSDFIYADGWTYESDFCISKVITSSETVNVYSS